MSERAAILRLARNLARQNARWYSAHPKRANQELDLADAIKKHNLREIPPTLWNELDAHLDHNPSLGLALVRLLHAIVKRRHNARLRATADLALIRALNVCGEFKQALALCPDAARRFEQSRDVASTQNVARLWLEAAWAETWLGNLEAAESCLERAMNASPALYAEQSLRVKVTLIRARILQLRGLLQEARACLEQGLAELGGAASTDAARILREIGLVQARLNPAQALAPLEQAHQIFQAADCPAEAALCRYCLAQAYIDLNRFEEARSELADVQRVFCQLGLRFFDALCEMEFGFIDGQLNHFNEYLTHTEKARALFVQMGAVQEISSCEVNIGVALEGLDRDAEALTYYERALQTSIATARHKRAALCLMNVGGIHDRQGRYAQALEHFQRARDEFAREGIVERLVECDLRLGRVYAHLGDYAQALAALNRARTASRRAKMVSRRAQCELYRGQLFRATRKVPSAQTALRRARELFTKNKETVYAAVCDRELANLGAENRELAIRLATSSRRVFERNGQRVEAALCDLTLGELHLAWQQNRQAQKYFERAQRVFEPGFPDYAWRAKYGLGRAALAQAQPQRALRELCDAVQTIANLRGGTGQESLSDIIFAARHDIFRETLTLALASGVPADVFTVVEAAKAQTFGRSLGNLEWGSHKPAQDFADKIALLQQEQTLRARITQLRQQVSLPLPFSELPITRSVLAAPTATATALQELSRLNREYETLVIRLRAMQPGLTGVPALEPFSVATFRAMADARWGEGWAALDYYLLKDQLVVGYLDAETEFVETVTLRNEDHVALEHCTLSQRDLRELTFRGTLRGYPVPSRTDWLQILTPRLLPPRVQAQLDALAQRQKQDLTILLSPHGILHQLPFHALKRDGNYLLECYTFIYTPTLQALEQLQRSSRPVKKRQTLLCGVEEFGARAQPLAYARQEINALRRQLDPFQMTLWGRRATRRQLMEWSAQGELAQFGGLHFGTHAVVDWQSPHLSHIALADENLTVLDVLALDLDAERVVLSACSSALGQLGRGDEMVSLARSFFYAGARALVASLWQVEDESTALLMKRLYQELNEGLDLAQALRVAQLALLRMGYTPYHWASFLHMGAV